MCNIEGFKFCYFSILAHHTAPKDLYRRIFYKTTIGIDKCLNISFKPDVSEGDGWLWGVKLNKSKNKPIFDVFFREKPAMMLVELKNADANVYASVLAKQIDCTYSHVVKILQEMQKSDLIRFKKEGRLKLLELTKRGTEIASNIESIRTML